MEGSRRPSRSGLGRPTVRKRRRGNERDVRSHSCLVARGGARPCSLVDRHRADRRSPPRARQQHGVRRRALRRERHRDRERWYFENYYALDERVSRLRHLPDSWRVHVTDLYTEEERKTSVAYNEALPRGHAQNSVSVRPRRTQGIAHRLGRQRPGRRGRLVVCTAGLDPASPAPSPTLGRFGNLILLSVGIASKSKLSRP